MDIRTFFGTFAVKKNAKGDVKAQRQRRYARQKLLPKIQCECGVSYQANDWVIAKHKKSKHHLSKTNVPPPEPIIVMTDDWEMTPTLQDIVNGCPLMSKSDEKHDILFRHHTEEELDELVCMGCEFRFPYSWGYDEDTKQYTKYDRRIITQKRWSEGVRWTLREFLSIARAYYRSNGGAKLKSLGDHRFFEGFYGNTFHLGS